MQKFSSLGPGTNIGGNVGIGECTAISLGAKVIENITIGKHTVIGAGALVIRNVGDFKIAFGIPAKEIRTREIGEGYLSGNKVKNKVTE
jgi:serine acetyltransferase